jgi:hypothetical protein
MDEIIGQPTVKDEPKPAESQVDRIKRELASIPDSYLRTYVESKAKEFEQLRVQYEQQLSWATIEIKRLGLLADKANFATAGEIYGRELSKKPATAVGQDKEAQSGGFEGYGEGGLLDAEIDSQ